MSTAKKFMGLTFLVVIIALLLRHAGSVGTVTKAFASGYSSVVGALGKL